MGAGAFKGAARCFRKESRVDWRSCRRRGGGGSSLGACAGRSPCGCDEVKFCKFKLHLLYALLDDLWDNDLIELLFCDELRSLLTVAIFATLFEDKLLF